VPACSRRDRHPNQFASDRAGACPCRGWGTPARRGQASRRCSVWKTPDRVMPTGRGGRDRRQRQKGGAGQGCQRMAHQTNSPTQYAENLYQQFEHALIGAAADRHAFTQRKRPAATSRSTRRPPMTGFAPAGLARSNRQPKSRRHQNLARLLPPAPRAAPPGPRASLIALRKAGEV
jgi:hypothetical protein